MNRPNIDYSTKSLMPKSYLVAWVMCLMICVVGVTLVASELWYYVPAEITVFTACLLGGILSLTSILKCVR